MKDEERGYPPYQWSIFPEGNRGEQYVVRADTVQDLETAINEVKLLIGKHTAQQTNVSSHLSTSDAKAIDEVMAGNAGDVMCPVHNVKMYEKTGKHGVFYSHGEKQPDGSWKNCNGKGWK